MSYYIKRKIFWQQLVSLSAVTALSLVGCTQDSPTATRKPLPIDQPFKIASTAFTADGLIPAKYTCDGKNISPPLTWSAAPPGTHSLVLIVDDPDAPSKVFVHWLLYNLPAELRHLPEGVVAGAELPNGGFQGKNDFGKIGYDGPCVPIGTHRYFFKLYALSESLNLSSGATKEQVIKAINGHILAASEVIGRYARI